MSQDNDRYWFTVKRYGYGWGFPTCWQGRLVFLAYAALLILGGFYCFRYTHAPVLWYCLLAVALTLALLAVCRLKGPPPRWRWGEEGQ